MRYLVLGQGKSGTTALFRAIETALEPPVRTYFEPKKLLPLSVPREKNVLAKVLVQHVTDVNVGHILQCERKVFICRDPRDVAISDLLYFPTRPGYLTDDQQAEFIDLLRRKQDRPQDVAVTEIFDTLARLADAPNRLSPLKAAMARASELWDRHGEQFHLCRYEDFVTGNYGELEMYLGLSLPSSVDVGSEFRRVERTRGSGDWKNWFTLADVEATRDVFSDYMAHFGYDDWTPAVDPIIAPNHGVEYVERTIDLERQRAAAREARMATAAAD